MALWLNSQPLVLASGSEVRGKILAAAGLRVEIRPSQIDERAEEAKSGIADAAAVARHLARAKASAIALRCQGELCLVQTRPWRGAANVSASRSIEQKRSSNCVLYAVEPMSFIPRSL